MVCQSPDELHGTNLASVLRLRTGPYPIQKLFKAFRAGTLDHFQAESQINCREKQPLWVHAIMSLVRNQEGHPVYMVVMVENITDQKQMEAELVEVERRLQDVGEEERVRLAQKLHDGPLQDLYGAMFQLKAITSSEVHDPKIREEFGNVESIMQGAINLLRSTTGDLHPPTLAHFGLEKAIRSHAENVQANHPEVAIQLELASGSDSLREPVRMALFRSFQELLGNAIRHSRAKTITVHYQTTEDELYLEIADDGMGFQVPNRWVDLVRQGHFGLVGVAERALSVGGSVHIQSFPGKATRIWLLVPRAESEQRQKERLSVLISEIPIQGKGSGMVRTEGTL
jgi:signal transduction histidine kinase